VNWKVKGEEGKFDLEGVDCCGPVEVFGLMSVKPSRRAEDGAAMVGWTLLGCISDSGGLIRDAVEGVWGGRFGDDMTAASGLLVASLTGLSSRSVTDSRFVEGPAFDWDCNGPDVSGGETLGKGVLLRFVLLFCYLPWRRWPVERIDEP
jgi:hypothetical protein